MSAPPVGLYSIGIRGLDPGALLALTGAERVPFVHLRGGPRGCDLARARPDQVAGWAAQARGTAPVTLVTTDVDLSAFLAPGTGGYEEACGELGGLAAAASALGARGVRLLGRAVPGDGQWETFAVPGPAATHGLAVLVELHHPAWFAQAAVASLCLLLDRSPGLALLLDSSQVQAAWLRHPDAEWPGLLASLVPRAAAVHLSDPGTGLDGTGHRLLAEALRADGAEGHRAEVAFEWTGPDRSPAVCLARYRDAVAWWDQAWEERS